MMEDRFIRVPLPFLQTYNIAEDGQTHTNGSLTAMTKTLPASLSLGWLM